MKGGGLPAEKESDDHSGNCICSYEAEPCNTGASKNAVEFCGIYSVHAQEKLFIPRASSYL